MKKFIDDFKKNLAMIPSKVEHTSWSEFLLLLLVLFILPSGTLLCLVALYFKFRNYLRNN